MSEPERWLSSAEPVAIYLDRLRTYQGDTLVDETVREQARQAVFDYVDDNLVTTYGSVTAHLEAKPDVPSVRAAERVVRYLAAHPSLDNEQRAYVADLFNTNAHDYHIDKPRRSLPGIDLVQPLIVELDLPIDELIEVR